MPPRESAVPAAPEAWPPLVSPRGSISTSAVLAGTGAPALRAVPEVAVVPLIRAMSESPSAKAALASRDTRTGSAAAGGTGGNGGGGGTGGWLYGDGGAGGAGGSGGPGGTTHDQYIGGDGVTAVMAAPAATPSTSAMAAPALSATRPAPAGPALPTGRRAPAGHCGVRMGRAAFKSGPGLTRRRINLAAPRPTVCVAAAA